MGSGLFTMMTMYCAYNMFDGKTVGKLPFEPWSLIQGMSHKGVDGDDT